MHDKFRECLAKKYQIIRSQFPGEGRRRWHLRVLQEFWNNTSPGTSPNVSPEDDFTQDDDPFDHLLEGGESGILLRTDYSNEDAWQTFCSGLQAKEQELADAMKPEFINGDAGASAPMCQTEDSDSDMEVSPFPVIKVIDPAPPEQVLFHNISNLWALRLLNDIDIRLAPSPPPGIGRVHPPNRLIDQGTWQEIYSGMNIWIYDTQSNSDRCVRLVSQEGDIYGTATGDSWRVQGSHICELQFNMSFLSMTVNFGGLDRWDYQERQRNLDQANQAVQFAPSLIP